MGDPRKQRRTYTAPLKRWDKEKIELERGLVKNYGLRRKKELWRLEALLRRFRSRAKRLIAKKDANEEKILLQKMHKLGVVKANANLDDVLSLQIHHLLDRRLQTIVFRSNLANTPKQARQFIVHGHIEVNGMKITTPSYIVAKDEEEKITFRPHSSLTTKFKKIEKKGKQPLAKMGQKTGEKAAAETPAEPQAAETAPVASETPVPGETKEKLEEIALEAEEVIGLVETTEEDK